MILLHIDSGCPFILPTAEVTALVLNRSHVMQASVVPDIFVAVVFNNTETVSELIFATAISVFPSPLKSPLETEYGLIPVVKSVLAVKEGVVAPEAVVFKNT